MFGIFYTFASANDTPPDRVTKCLVFSHLANMFEPIADFLLFVVIIYSGRVMPTMECAEQLITSF